MENLPKLTIFNMEFSDEVKKIILVEMNRQGITAYRMSKDLNISQGNLSNFFSGKQNLSLDKFDKIFAYLGLEKLEAEFKFK